METEAEFTERRRLAHEQAALEADNDYLIAVAFNRLPKPAAPLETMLFQPGCLRSRQA